MQNELLLWSETFNCVEEFEEDIKIFYIKVQIMLMMKIKKVNIHGD